MKFRISEHPSVFLFLISLVILGISIFLNVLYQWKIYSIVAIVLAGIAVLVLGYSMVKDISSFLKKKSAYDENHVDEKKDDEDW
jgi:positive regulator of sigma E activity